MRFVIGLLLGLCALGGYLGYERWQASEDPCRGRCGEGTRCGDAGLCLAQAKANAPRKQRRGRRRRGRRRRSGASEDLAPVLKKPSAAELRAASKGASLGGADRIDMTSGGNERELDEAEVERRFRALDPRILDCIEKAREGWDVGGRVVVAFRIERSGAVNKVRVSAPALMQRQGIYHCVGPLVRALRFPSSGRSLIMSYPYRLD